MFSVRSLTSRRCAAISCDRIVGKLEMHAFGFQQRYVLLDQRVLRLGQDAHEIVLAQGLELDADREAPLELRESGPTAWRCETLRRR